jgi:hypothetical protein
LPTDPIDRAATCAVVAAAGARKATADVHRPLSLAAKGRILHYALLAATAYGRFSIETAGAVTRRMNILEADVTSGRWQDLEPACADAFPEAEKTDPSLPADRLDAQLGCSELAQFAATTLEPDKAAYASELAGYRRLRTRLSDRVGPALRARAGPDLGAQREAAGKAMAKLVRLGSPIPLLAECMKRFAPD